MSYNLKEQLKLIQVNKKLGYNPLNRLITELQLKEKKYNKKEVKPIKKDIKKDKIENKKMITRLKKNNNII